LYKAIVTQQTFCFHVIVHCIGIFCFNLTPVDGQVYLVKSYVIKLTDIDNIADILLYMDINIQNLNSDCYDEMYEKQD